MEYTDDEEELLNLSLAIVTSESSGDHGRTMKRKRGDALSPKLRSYEGCEEKIFRLLQMREQMLKLDRKSTRSSQLPDQDHGNGLHLIHLLLITATAVDQNKVGSALENLTELYRSVSPTGGSLQRVVAYFADGLAARFLTRKSPFYNMIMKEPTDEEEFLAFTDLYRVSPYYQFAHFTANQCILEAFEKEEDKNNRTLHVVDFDVSYGLQWPSLIQSISEKASTGNRISLKITGFGTTSEQLQETEDRLASFSKGFRNLNFKFQGLLRGGCYDFRNLRKKKNETLAVNLVFYSLNNETLKSVHSLNPSIVILVEQEGSKSPRSFLSRFMESLHCFAALFDSLDDCLPLESAERLSIEKNHLGKEIKACLTTIQIHAGRRRMRGWTRGRRGWRGMVLWVEAESGGGGGGFRVSERDGGGISLGWQDRCLLTASAWHCVYDR
ncbi:hypothetical protein SLA2020_474180 [Shorea laevis]